MKLRIIKNDNEIILNPANNAFQNLIKIIAYLNAAYLLKSLTNFT